MVKPEIRILINLFLRHKKSAIDSREQSFQKNAKKAYIPKSLMAYWL